jgi:competence protein ComEA
MAALEFVGLARLAAAAVSVLGVVAGGWWLLRAPDPPVERQLPYTARAGGSSTTAPRTGSSPPSTSRPAPPTTDTTIVVQVAGAVSRPGVYAMAAGSRVHELLARAGGPAAGADPNALALAAPLTDGERVYVPKVGEVIPAGGGIGSARPGTGSGTAPPVGPVDLNRATADELDLLPGIGPSTAQAIVDYRDQHGPFGSVDELLDVRGIGPAKLDAIRDLVTT